ncbi:hypothetical protein FDP41_002257 [Naegleria fowleri]|uniref:Uncharacterized protein n=1 Tax=Naegleria fowleri TaxID=5763 RepID=A0A6A5BN21_NAEFO|nr:uncharacterized protein FDP41_002257 [Naegleria fowleri]KAF0978437.1 hypothetical protein FDP41_002257 [Naegleria fowleri]
MQSSSTPTVNTTHHHHHQTQPPLLSSSSTTQDQIPPVNPTTTPIPSEVTSKPTYEGLFPFLEHAKEEGIEFSCFTHEFLHHYWWSFFYLIMGSFGYLVGPLYCFSNLWLRYWRKIVCGVCVTRKNVADRIEVLGCLMCHRFNWLGTKYLIISLICVKKQFRQQFFATAMVDYLIYHFKKQLPFSEIDVVMVSDVDAYDSPSWFLCNRANLQVWPFMQQISWWRLFYPATLFVIPHYIPGKFIRARILNVTPSKVSSHENIPTVTPANTSSGTTIGNTTTKPPMSTMKSKTTRFLEKLCYFVKSCFSPQGERRYYIAAENVGFYSFLVSTLFGMLFLFLGRQMVNDVYNLNMVRHHLGAGEFLNSEENSKLIYKLVPYREESHGSGSHSIQHTTIFSWLYLDMMVALTLAFVFPITKFVCVNLSSLLIKKKFCLFRCYDTMAFTLFVRTVFTGSPITLPFIGGYYIADPSFNYRTLKGRKTIFLIGLPFVVLCLMVLFVVTVPLLIFRFHDYVSTQEREQDSWFVWFCWLGFFAAFYSLFECFCVVFPSSASYHLLRYSKERETENREDDLDTSSGGGGAEVMPQIREEKREYENYLSSYYNNGYGKMPKAKNVENTKYSTGHDFTAAKGDKLTPLARIWIDRDKRQRKQQAKLAATSSANVTAGNEQREEKELESLCHLIRDHFDFELKFHIICMIPTYTEIKKRRDHPHRRLFTTYFGGEDETIYSIRRDPLLVTYHKYRLLCKTFNVRVQHYLMSSHNGCDELNMANMLMHLYNQRTNQMEVEGDLDSFMSKMALLLCFINTKKLYLAKKVLDFDHESIYHEYPKVFNCLKSCWNELYKLKTDADLGAFVLNGSIPYYRMNYYHQNIDDSDSDGEEEDGKEKTKKKDTSSSREQDEESNATSKKVEHDENLFQDVSINRDGATDQGATSETLDLIDDENKNNKDDTLLVYTEEENDMLLDNNGFLKDRETTDNEEEEVSEETLMNEIDSRSTSHTLSTNVSFTRMFLNSTQKQEMEYQKVQKQAVKNFKGLQIEDGEFKVDFENNDLQIKNPRELYNKFFHKAGELPAIYKYETYSSLSSYFQTIAPIYSYETYLCALLRFKLRVVLPALFNNDFYADNYQIFRSLTLVNLTYCNSFNNLLLHILIENGKQVPEDITIKENATFNQACGIQELSFVNFTFDQLLVIFSNDRSYYPSSGNYDASTKDPYALKGLTNFAKMDETKRKYIFSSLGNTVSRVNLYFYGDYVYTLSPETYLFSNFTPNITDLRIIAKTRENNTVDSQVNTVCNSCVSDFSADYFRKRFQKIIILAEGKPQKELDWKDGNDVSYQQDEEGGLKNVLFNSKLPLLEKEAIPSTTSTLTLRIMLMCQMTKDLLNTFLEHSDLVFEKLPVANFLLTQSNGFPIAQKKALIDLMLKEHKYPFSVIDTFSYDFTEEKRILEEYLIHLANCNDGRLLGLENITYDSTFSWLMTLMYYGWDFLKDNKVFEELMLGAQLSCGRLGNTSTEGEACSVLSELFMAKLFYENLDTKAFVDLLLTKCKFSYSGDMEELLTQVETECSQKDFQLLEKCDNEDDQTKRNLQLFFTYITRPKKDVTTFEKQVLQLTPDKIFVLLINSISDRDLKKFDTILTLGQAMKDFNKVFDKTIHMQITNRYQNDIYSLPTVYKYASSDIDKVDIVNSKALQLKFTRRKHALRLIYEKGLALDHTFSIADLDNAIAESESDTLEINLFLYLLVSASVPVSVVLTVLERLSPEQLLFQDSNGNNALHIAVLQLFTSQDLYSLLLKKQPKLVDMVNKELNTPLHFACYQSIDTLFLVGRRLVQEYKSRTDVVNGLGLTPYEVAAASILRDVLNGGGGVTSWSHFDLNWLLPPQGLTKEEMFKQILSRK